MRASNRRSIAAAWVLLCGAPTLACDSSKPSPTPVSDEAKTKTKGEAEPADPGAAEAGGGEQGPAEAAAKAATPMLFVKDQRKKGCEMLPPAMVARVLEVPEAELEQQKIMGCIYSWEGGGQVAEASVMSIWVKNTPEEARTWFDNSTKTVSAEELQAQMAKVKELAKEREEVDTKAKDEAVDQVGDVVVGMTPDEGYRYEDVPGVGDAARVQTHEGAVTVLLGNMVFGVRAYKGPPAPPPDAAAVMSGDVKKVMAASKKAQDEFFAQTRDVRRELAIEVAKAIVEGM